MNSLTVIFVFCVVYIASCSCGTYVYKFGEDFGDVVYNSNGVIGLFVYNTVVNIPVPEDESISYVEVTVQALAPPKVDYDSEKNSVSISYSAAEVTASKYSILAKAYDDRSSS